MADDFWGREHLENVKAQPSKVLPDVPPVDLPLSYPIFNMVYDLQQKPQALNIDAWNQGLNLEPLHGDMSDPKSHFLAYYDENGKILIL